MTVNYLYKFLQFCFDVFQASNVIPSNVRHFNHRLTQCRWIALCHCKLDQKITCELVGCALIVATTSIFLFESWGWIFMRMSSIMKHSLNLNERCEFLLLITKWCHNAPTFTERGNKNNLTSYAENQGKRDLEQTTEQINKISGQQLLN